MFKGKHMIPGRAVVVEKSFSQSKWQSSSAETLLMDYVLDVTPSEGEPFRVQVAARILTPDPATGDEVKVRCDPVKRKAEFDLEGDPRYDQKLIKAKEKADHDALLNAPVGTEAPGLEEERERILNRLAAKQSAGPKWHVPSECPNCGARIEQATKDMEQNPHCDFCNQPLPLEPAH